MINYQLAHSMYLLFMYIIRVYNNKKNEQRYPVTYVAYNDLHQLFICKMRSSGSWQSLPAMWKRIRLKQKGEKSDHK